MILIKLFLLLVGALYIYAGWNDYKRTYPFMLRYLGKKSASHLGNGIQRGLMLFTGSVLGVLALAWIF